MTEERMVLEGAYSETLRDLYTAMFRRMVEANTDDLIDEAVLAFTKGVILARRTRDLAILALRL
jgi:hypothetical protein